MKEIIDVKLTARTADLDRYKTDVLALGLFSDAKGLDRSIKWLDRQLERAIGKLIKLGDFKGKEGTGAVVYGDGRIGAKRVLLVGLGEKKAATLDTIRKAAAYAAKKSVEMKAKTVGLALHCAFGAKFDSAEMGQACAEGTCFGSYRYDESLERRHRRPGAELCPDDRQSPGQCDIPGHSGGRGKETGPWLEHAQVHGFQRKTDD
jgi:leucyl aminopeptidase